MRERTERFQVSGLFIKNRDDTSEHINKNEIMKLYKRQSFGSVGQRSATHLWKQESLYSYFNVFILSWLLELFEGLFIPDLLSVTL